MTEIGIDSARKVLGDLVDEAQEGNDVVLTRYGTPVARITTITSSISYSTHRPPDDSWEVPSWAGRFNPRKARYWEGNGTPRRIVTNGEEHYESRDGERLWHTDDGRWIITQHGGSALNNYRISAAAADTWFRDNGYTPEDRDTHARRLDTTTGPTLPAHLNECTTNDGATTCAHGCPRYAADPTAGPRPRDPDTGAACWTPRWCAQKRALGRLRRNDTVNQDRDLTDLVTQLGHLLAGDHMTDESIHALNTYAGGNVWNDVIRKFDLNEAATEEIDPSAGSDRFVLANGSIIAYDRQTEQWHHAGRYEGTASDDAMISDPDND